MVRASYLAFGLIAYVVFFATFLYLVAFVGDLPGVPVTVDRGPPAPTGVALFLDLALVTLFGIQHSVMARPAFKAVWTRIVPRPVERSIYVLFASLVLIVLFTLWRPLPFAVWNVTGAVGVAVIWGLFVLGFAIVLLSTFLLSHFELFGLKQVYLNLTGREPGAPSLAQPFFYRFVRHPLYSGFIIAFWATPEMTLGHLVFASAMSAYILLAIPHEERDLVAHFGADYEAYRSRVGMLTPRLRRSTLP